MADLERLAEHAAVSTAKPGAPLGLLDRHEVAEVGAARLLRRRQHRLAPHLRPLHPEPVEHVVARVGERERRRGGHEQRHATAIASRGGRAAPARAAPRGSARAALTTPRRGPASAARPPRRAAAPARGRGQRSPSSSRSCASARLSRDFTVPCRQPSTAARLGLGQVEDVAEHDDLALGGLEPRERPASARAAESRPTGSGASSDGSARAARDARCARRPAERAPVARLVGDDLQQPRPPRRARAEAVERG